MTDNSVSGNDIEEKSVSGNEQEVLTSVSGGDAGENSMTVSGNDKETHSYLESLFSQPIEVHMESPEPISLWNSNINDYNVTEGLLLCILVVLLFDIFMKDRRR